jgi:serine/threonine protein kinase
VAIKTVSRSSLSTKLVENLQSEIDILKSLSHRHITKLIDIIVRFILLLKSIPPLMMSHEAR